MQTLEKNMNRSETKFKGVNMAVIDNVLKKYDTKATTKKTSMSVKFDTTLYNDLETICSALGISKNQLIIDILEASGLGKKAEEMRLQINTQGE